MKVGFLFATAAAVLLIGLSAGTAEAGGPRQYYGAWQKAAGHSYYHRNLYYKPTASFAGYKHHYVIYHPSRPKHYYFYNPYKKTYWGRCPSNYGDTPTYSLLPPEYQKQNLNDIPENAFPQPGPVPALSGTTDGERLDLPPDDLPHDAAAQPGPNALPPVPPLDDR